MTVQYIPPVPIDVDLNTEVMRQWMESVRSNINNPKSTPDLANPTTDDIPSGTAALWKNATSGEVRLWYNDGGVLKSVLLS